VAAMLEALAMQFEAGHQTTVDSKADKAS